MYYVIIKIIGGRMFDIEVVKHKKINTIDSKLLHKALNVRSYHADWIRRRIDGYGFVENEDYYLAQFSTVRGGSKRKDYYLTLDMAKELCMIENTEEGRKARKYFIDVEKQYRKQEVARIAGVRTRKTLTDAIEESGENERMHGRGHSNYTLLVYAVTGLKQRFKMYKNACKDVGVKPNDFRGTLSVEEIKRVDLAESLIKPMLELEKEYSEIKEAIIPLFEVKEIE